MTKSLIQCPRDEGPHVDSFEWWHWNANLKSANGTAASAMFALFKAKPIPLLPELWSSHSIVSLGKDSKSAPRFGFYPALDHSTWKKDGFSARADNQFEMKRDGPRTYALSTPDMDLRFTAVKPPFLVGGTGQVDLGTSRTFYYSLPRLEAEGTIRINAKPIRVRGLVWMDHQWNPIVVSRENVWNWFSFHLSDGTDLQCFEFGRTKPVRLATVSRPDGSSFVSKRVTCTPSKRKWTSPTTDIPYDLSWRIRIPEAKIDLTVEPVTRKNEVLFGPVVYWEGSTRVHGSVHGHAVTGDGFLEIVPSVDLKRVALSLAKKSGQDVLHRVESAVRSVLTRVG